MLRAHSDSKHDVLEQVLLELAVLFALCVGVAVTFHRLRLPPIVGFLVAGVFVGPHAIGLVQHEVMVRELAEVGIVVMLFAVGLEVPLPQLRRLRRQDSCGCRCHCTQCWSLWAPACGGGDTTPPPAA